MFLSLKEEIRTDIIKYKISNAGKILSCKETIELLKISDDFIGFFTEQLKQCPFDAYFWEVRPVTIKNMDEDFEFVLVNSSALSKIKADKSAFADYFKSNEKVTSFANLNGDARLVVPYMISEADNYAHIANFVRQAPHEQLLLFWKKVGEEFANSIGSQYKWLSTSGLGVHWLHVRIDSKPKYYSYQQYKKIEF